MASVPPPPIQTPLTDDRPARVGRVWTSWFRDMHKYLVSVVVDSVAAHLADTSGAHAASAISNSPTGNLAATDVQGALNELQTDVDGRASASHPHSAADITSGTLAVVRGGTGTGTFTKGDVIYSDAANSLAKLGVGSTGQALKVGTSGVPEWGAAGGSGGVNFLGLSSTWALSSQDDRDFETSVGNWVAYADAAATSPVDMTGGAPGTTMTRVTASQLNGVGSGKMDLGSGSSRQGEGVACVAYVPEGYRGQNAAFTAQWVATGALVEDDLRLFIYDVTNSELITPTSYSKIVGTRGTWVAIFPTKTTTAQIRVGVHVARTSTAALAITFDDVAVGPAIPAVGMNGSDWRSDLTFTPSAGFGTVSLQSIWYKFVGDSACVRGYWKCGTVAVSEANITLPFTIDASKLTSTASVQRVGKWTRIQTAVGNNSGQDDGPIFYDGSTTNKLYFAYYDGSNVFQKNNVSGVFLANSDGLVVEFEVPIANRSSNVQLGQSSVYKMSSYLANGTRVTGAAPTALGQYRSYLRNASAATYTETNGAPTSSPTLADGIALYRPTAWGTASTNNNPVKYEIFVGKNKNVRFDFFGSIGRTGSIDAKPGEYATSRAIGLSSSYDPTTGIATVVSPTDSNYTNAGYLGWDGTGQVQATGAFFDIVVSENPLFVSADPLAFSGQVLGSSYAELTTGGSGATTIPADNTIPQITEGNEILTLTYTPRRANSYLLVEAITYLIESSNTGDFLTAALFRDSTANAIGVGYVSTTSTEAAAINAGCVSVATRVTADSVAATTFRLRVGNNAGSIRWMATTGGTALYGGAMRTVLKVTEVAP